MGVHDFAQKLAAEPRIGFGARASYIPVFLVAACVTAYFGAHLVEPSRTDELRALAEHDAFKLWKAMIGVLLVVTLAGAVVTMPMAWRLLKKFPVGRRWWLVVSTLITAVAGAIAVYWIPKLVDIHSGNSKELMIDIQSGMLAVFSFAFLFLLAPILVLVLVTASAREVELPPAIGAFKSAATALHDLRAPLNSALTWLAIPISLTVIVTGQLRNALIAVNPGVSADYPIAYVLLYGAVLAAFLCALYIPAHTELHRMDEKLVNARYPFDGTEQRETDRMVLSDYLGHTGDGAKHYMTIFAAVSPFVTSLVAFFIPTAA